MWIYHILLIHSSVDGHFGGFHLLVIVSSAAVNIHVQIMCVFNIFFLGHYYSSFVFWLHRMACRISIPQPGTEPWTMAVKVLDPNQ